MADLAHLRGQVEAWRETTATRRGARLDRKHLLNRLEPATYTPAADEQQIFDQASLGRVLPLLVGADQEGTYQLVREVTTVVLGHVPDLEDFPQ